MKSDRGSFHMLRREERMTQSVDIDAYHPGTKFPEPTRCPDCGATYHKGRWTWDKAKGETHSHRCPACQRIHDQFPAGILTMHGKLPAAERVEVVNLIRLREQRAKLEHPLQRVISIETTASGMLVTTTDTHLARGLAHALRDAFGGTLDFSYGPEENLLRVVWKI